MVSPMTLNIWHHNTPGTQQGEGIVHSSSNTGNQSDRLPDHKYHNRHGHGVRNPAEPAPSNRGSCHPHRRGNVHRSGRQVALEVGQPTTTREALEGYNLLPGASSICERRCLVL